MNLKDRTARIISYSWIIFVLFYILRRMNITATYSTFLPTASKTVIYNIGMGFSWFGILSMPAFLLLILTKPEEQHEHKILRFGFFMLALITASILIAYFALR